ncbi:DEAD/DEAH box helicase [Chitinimonas sp. BJB300]|uniref:DEAD/DEAH box helicase n=1 Tax=Chitinimonas sp. BJB300 TaxID=1559339 RepID=UPI000C0CA639|nr:DEAD/DEAH box helicase [Chitinimonas sp. BJB300]PHV09741.1 RNA helicase [Chitinimonas sp. BJB300]TSJ87205.1 DEAD/DEAH box helicase [Chitinimonas sp. BJB300]
MTQVTFADLGLAQPILDTLITSGYTQPTPIQAAAIPALMSRRDVMASAATGTGKTAAFMLPALNFLTEKSEKPGKGPRILVLSPTRELAAQIKTAAETYGKQIRHAKVVSVVGGMPYPLQIKLLSSPVEILVATPGRLIDLIERGRIDLSRLEMLVLDEADRMLDLGFRDDIAHIATKLPKERVTALFSATLDGDIATIAQSLLNNPERIEIAAPARRQEQIVEKLHYADDITHKTKLLDHILADEAVGQAIIFIATKLDAGDLADRLLGQGKKAAALHGDMPQRERTRTLARLKKGEVDVLVATDVAARGIDVAGITHVVNFDLPKFAEDYVHRIGRTGRAGREGVAISFAAKHEVPALRRIEKFIGRKINSVEFEGLKARFEPRPSNGSGGGRFGEKRSFSGGRDSSRPNRFEDRKPYGDREQKPYGERKSFGDRKPAGDRPAYNSDRPAYADRKPQGERKSYGDRQPAFNDGNSFDRKPRQGNFKGLEADPTLYAEQPRLTLHSPFESGNRKSSGNTSRPQGNGNSTANTSRFGSRSDAPRANAGKRGNRPSFPNGRDFD